MVKKHFNKLNIPTHWEQYWSKYPNGYSIMEALIDWVSQVDDMVDSQNKLTDHVDAFKKSVSDTTEGFNNTLTDFLERFDDELNEEVTNILGDWQVSGFLDFVINQSLDTKYHEMNNRLTTQLAETDFEATRKRKLEDLSEEVLSAIEGGEGTSFELLSIPQNKSVSLDKLSDDTSNLLTDRVSGSSLTPVLGSLAPNNGSETSGNNRVRTDFLVIEGKTLLLLNNFSDYHLNVFIYRTDNSFVKTTGWIEQPYRIDGEYKIRCLIALKNNRGINESEISTLANSFQSYSVSVKEDDIVSNAVTSSKISNMAVSKEKTDFITTSTNKFNPNSVIESVDLLPGNGEEIESEGYSATDFIRVEAGQHVTATRFNRAYYYDNQRTLYKYLNNNNPPNEFTTTADMDGYVRFRALKSQFNNNPQVNFSSELLPYEPYFVRVDGFRIGVVSGSVEVNPDQAKAVFVEEMNKKAKFLGMTNTLYNRAAGTDEDMSNHYSTVEDVLKMGIHSLGYGRLLEMFNAREYDVEVKGNASRTVTLENRVINPDLTDHYHMILGKTGGATDYQTLWCAVEHPNKKDILVGVVTGNHEESRDVSAKELFDIAVAVMEDEDTTNMDIGCDYGIVAVLPRHIHPLSLASRGYDILWSKNEKERIRPASTSKTMAAMVTLDQLYNLESYHTILKNDVQGGFNSHIFSEADIVSVKDMLYASMLHSNNTLTELMRRVVGEEIVRNRGL